MIFLPPVYLEILLLLASWISALIVLPMVKKRNKKVIFFVLGMIVFFLIALKVRHLRLGFTKNEETAVFIGPDQNHLIKNKISKNMIVQILNEKNNFYKVSYDTDMGWINRSDVSL